MNRRIVMLVLVLGSPAFAQETAAERGKKALESTAFISGLWTSNAYGNAWKRWGVAEKPKDYDKAFREYYGLNEAPYPNKNLPMGLRESNLLVFKGLAIDCMTCHGGSIFGKSIIGLGNTQFDAHALFDDLNFADGRNLPLPFTFSNVRGTSEAGGMSVYLLGFRDPDLSLTRPRKDLGLKDDLCEDTPAWWLLKKKKSMYYTGGADARSVRSKMQFMMSPLTTLKDFEKHEAAFHDIQEYMLAMEPPKYPEKIDTELAAKGEKLFLKNCASCHGTYGKDWTYPNKIIPLDEIGTDPKRYYGISEKFGDYYNQTWFAQEKARWYLPEGKPIVATKGYQAPPLDGIWATAPYFHNGSVPTLYGVLNSKARPERFTRSFKTEKEDYDFEKIGWKIKLVKENPPADTPPTEKRKIYDTTQPGRSNTGHTYGDKLTDPERMALIEYLKTL